MVNRFHATFLADLDTATLEAVEAGDTISGSVRFHVRSNQGERSGGRAVCSAGLVRLNNTLAGRT